MDQHITVTSGLQNPCDFISNFTDAININDGYEVAVTKICHAPIINITGEYCNFAISIEQKGDPKTIVHCSIPPGFYESTCSLAEAINAEINFKRWNDELPAVATLAAGVIKLSSKEPRMRFIANPDEYGKLLNVFGVCLKTTETQYLKFDDDRLDNTNEVAFLYSNIVTNSVIDQGKARLLALLPIESKPGYNVYEASNRIYYRLSVHSFTDITFVFCNVKGEVMDMEHRVNQDVMFPTIIQLHIKPINRP